MRLKMQAGAILPIFGFDTDKLNAISAPKIDEIPALARGAVIPPNREFLAILGDQKSGTNIEAPLSTIEQAVDNVLSKRGNIGSETVIRFDGTMGQLIRAMKPYIEAEDKRKGIRLVNQSI